LQSLQQLWAPTATFRFEVEVEGILKLVQIC